MGLEIDLLAPEVVADPHPFLHALRREDPVHWSQRHQAWLLTRYDDVVAGFRDLSFSSERTASLVTETGGGTADAETGPAGRVLANWMEFRDPPDHTRLRRLVQKAFTPRVAEGMRPRIEAIVGELLDGLEHAGRADFVRDFAFPLPATVIAEMLGVPTADRDRFREWSTAIKGLVFGSSEPGRLARAHRGFAELEAYFAKRLATVRDSPDQSLLAALAAAQERDDLLSPAELIGTAVLLLFGGHETTTSLISTGLWVLAQHPDEMERLRGEPERLPALVEELLRYDGPLKLMVREAREPRELRGRHIRPGSRVFLMQSAANRDPEQFPDPDRFDPARFESERRETLHLAFGHGIHFCLGAPLARLEARVALGTVLERFPALRVETEAPQWEPSLLGRTLVRLPIDVTA